MPQTDFVSGKGESQLHKFVLVADFRCRVQVFVAQCVVSKLQIFFCEGLPAFVTG